MKNFVFLLLLVLLASCVNGQSAGQDRAEPGEFVVHKNGLIYDSVTMAYLGKVVDSLNLRFKKCEPKTYYSLEQGYGTYVSISENVKKAGEAIRRNMPLDEFLRKFKPDEVEKNVRVVKYTYTYDGNRHVVYRSEGESNYYVPVPDSVQYHRSQGWVYCEYGYGETHAFYLHDLRSTIIPLEHARLIQYVDCMIDTTTTIFPYKEREDDSLLYELAPGSKIKAFLDVAMDFGSKPVEPELDYNDPGREEAFMKYWTEYRNWDSLRILALDVKMQNADNMKLLNDAVEEAIPAQNGFFIDDYAQRYLSPAKALALKRSFRVTGFCSVDARPRMHAVDICRLAAQNYQWDIFLRAHLDVLNDNFERATDGSYAWAGRGTYIKELEELDIDAIDLLIGTNLQTSNVSENHYLAGPSRVGRALAESKDKPRVINLLDTMIRDERLDLHNRMTMAYTLIFFNRHLTDKAAYRANLKRIKASLETLPKDVRKSYSELMKD